MMAAVHVHVKEKAPVAVPLLSRVKRVFSVQEERQSQYHDLRK